MNRKDDLYRDDAGLPGSFRFDERVVEVFPDMIQRSVPGYGLIVPMIGQLSRRYAQPHTRVHDLGSSLGAVTLAMRGCMEAEGVTLVATDSSQAMTDRFLEVLAGQGEGVPVQVACGDVRDVDFSGSSFVVLNFTLQFVPPGERTGLLARIAEGLVPGGALVLSEKVRFEDVGEQARQTEWHHDFKRLQGYSELEIARKRTALERVLEPETEKRHLHRLRQAGFERVTRWFQCFAFCSFLAEK
jgi:tRNA (cmo5U34)-methyltransferase